MMVEHHLGQQEPGEEPEGAAESTGTQESCPPGITDTAAESRSAPLGNIQCVQLRRDQPRGRPVSIGYGEGLSSSQKLS